VHLVDSKYREQSLQAIIQQRGLTEVEAKCIIMYTMESTRVSRDQQLYKLFCQAYRQRNEEALDAFADFSFHFWNGLSKLPDHAQLLYRGLNKRLADINDLYDEGNTVHWHYPSHCTTDKAIASTFSDGGTLLSLQNVTNAKCIQDFSLIPSEREFLIDFTAKFEVHIALTCEKAKALKQFSSDLPPDVDLVVLIAKAPASSHFSPSFFGISSPTATTAPLVHAGSVHGHPSTLLPPFAVPSGILNDFQPLAPASATSVFTQSHTTATNVSSSSVQPSSPLPNDSLRLTRPPTHSLPPSPVPPTVPPVDVDFYAGVGIRGTSVPSFQPQVPTDNPVFPSRSS
jgi:hypothetical protein